MRDTLSQLAGLRPIGKPKPIPAHAHTRAAAGSGSNVDRLVAAAREMLQTFGGGGFAGIAETEIRNHVDEAGGARALARLHELSAPPYR